MGKFIICLIILSLFFGIFLYLYKSNFNSKIFQSEFIDNLYHNTYNDKNLDLILQNHKNIKYMTYTIFYDQTQKFDKCLQTDIVDKKKSEIEPLVKMEFDIMINNFSKQYPIIVQKTENIPGSISKNTLKEIQKLYRS